MKIYNELTIQTQHIRSWGQVALVFLSASLVVTAWTLYFGPLFTDSGSFPNTHLEKAVREFLVSSLPEYPRTVGQRQKMQHIIMAV